MNVAYFHDEQQEKLLRQSIVRIEQNLKTTVRTKSLPATLFYPAEDYHQKYYVQNNDRFMAEYKTIFKSFQDFVDSTAVARVNGYLGGFGTPDRLRQEITKLGLTEENQRMLQKIGGA